MVRTFKFVGNGKNDPTSCNGWGYEFIYGRNVDVNDPHVIKKLEGNSHFEEVTSKPKQEEQKPQKTQNKKKNGRK